MGTIKKRGERYFAQIYVNKTRKSKTFSRLLDAKQWMLVNEVQARDVGKKIIQIKFSTCLETYIEQVVNGTPGARHKINVLRMLSRDYFGEERIHLIKSQDIDAMIEDRLSRPSSNTGLFIKESTVSRQLTYLSGFFNWAVKGGYCLSNPCKGLAEKLKSPPHRERVATEEDLERLFIASGWREGFQFENMTQVVCAAFLFSCLTGMRAGELLQIERSWIRGDALYIPADATKTKHSRTIALSSRAKRLLESICLLGYFPSIWNLNSSQRDALWRKLRDKAGLGAIKDSKGRTLIEGLTFHDGRATFCTWAASPGPDGAPRLDVMALARQTGHTNFKMLMKYYRPSISDVAKRLG